MQRKGKGMKCIRYYRTARVERLPDDEAEKAVQAKQAFFISKTEFKLARSGQVRDRRARP